MTDEAPMTDFAACVRECLAYPELVREFNRLYGCSLGASLKRAPIERMIDVATGYQVELDRRERESMDQFVAFVWRYVWLPLTATPGERQGGLR